MDLMSVQLVLITVMPMLLVLTLVKDFNVSVTTGSLVVVKIAAITISV